ncbi:hypothetical protein Tco_0741312, partial [Tanacetum coccineum]
VNCILWISGLYTSRLLDAASKKVSNLLKKGLLKVEATLKSAWTEKDQIDNLLKERRYVVPTGRVKVPAGRYVVPTGKDNVIVSTGRTKVIPAGSTILVLLCAWILGVGRVMQEPCTIRVKYEYKVFGHVMDKYRKKIVSNVLKNLKTVGKIDCNRLNTGSITVKSGRDS